MKIISKRARAVGEAESTAPRIEGIEITEHTVIITDSSSIMTPEEIKRAEQIFRDIRKQLEDLQIS